MPGRSSSTSKARSSAAALIGWPAGWAAKRVASARAGVRRLGGLPSMRSWPNRPSTICKVTEVTDPVGDFLPGQIDAHQPACGAVGFADRSGGLLQAGEVERALQEGGDSRVELRGR